MKDKMTKANNEPLDELLIRFGLTDLDWDFILVGDGSGSNWKKESGWACTSIEKANMERKIWFGAMNSGTVNFSEMMAYLQPLNWYASRELDKRAATHRVEFPRVHIFTDSKYCKDMGDSGSSGYGAKRKNFILWNLFSSFARAGILVHWHWIPRGSLELNVLVDKISKEARKNLSNFSQEVAEKNDPYKINP